MSIIVSLVFMYKLFMCSQELLAAVEKERLLRSMKISSVASPTIYYSRVDEEDEDDDSDHVSVCFSFKNIFLMSFYTCLLLGENGSLIIRGEI